LRTLFTVLYWTNFALSALQFGMALGALLTSNHEEAFVRFLMAVMNGLAAWVMNQRLKENNFAN
jgi:hypothetical protein